MPTFYDRKYDVLLATTIIETGIDIPSANTIVIDRADKFGLAQVHQLRGSRRALPHQAYAYLLLPEHSRLSNEAHKRIEAIQAANTLGAGFTLATMTWKFAALASCQVTSGVATHVEDWLYPLHRDARGSGQRHHSPGVLPTRTCSCRRRWRSICVSRRLSRKTTRLTAYPVDRVQTHRQLYGSSMSRTTCKWR